MSTRSKLRKLFHRGDHDDEPNSPSSNASTGSPVQPTRYEGTSPGQSPRIGQRPLSGTGPASPSPAHVKARKSMERRSLDSTKLLERRSMDGQTASSTLKDRQPPVIPPMPAVDHSFDTPPAVPQHTAGVSGHSRIASGNAPNFSQPLSTRQGRHSEDVADWNIMKAHRPNNSDAVPAPLNVAKRSGEAPNGDSDASVGALGQPLGQQRPLSQASVSSQPIDKSRRTSVSRKPLATIPSSTGADDFSSNGHRRGLSTAQQNRASLDKPLPTQPVANAAPAEDIATSKHLSSDSQYLVKDATNAPSLKGIVNLHDTVDTTVNSAWAPAVTHEQVNREVHHIREERITRDIHYHDVYHRVLPIIDIEVMPARHYVRNADGTLREITEAEVPGTSQYSQNWFIAETMSKIPTGGMAHGPRRFTAKQFTSGEGDYREYTSDNGVPTTETTWIHPPTVETAAFLQGKTTPFHLGSSDPAHDGFRGPITHTSGLYWREEQGPPTGMMEDLSINGSSAGHANGASRGGANGNASMPGRTAEREKYARQEKSFI